MDQGTGGAPSPHSRGLAAWMVETAERQQANDWFELESERMLRAHVQGRVWSKLGAMVAYRGQLTFKREGMLEGGVSNALMKFVSGEMAPLVKIEGEGMCYLADQGKHITVLRLEGDEINVNGNDLLAFQDSVAYAITMHKRVAGMLSGGLFSVKLSGHGLIAVLSHGRPLTLRVAPGFPVFTDPNATVAWSGHLSPELKMDASLRTLLGRGGGETFQMMFQGDGFVVVQPYEESPVIAGQGRV